MDYTLTAASFDKIARAYKECKNKETAKELCEAFVCLADRIITAFGTKIIATIDRDDVIQELLCFCFDRTERFDPDKGRAFNYYTTIMLSFLRQTYRTKKDYGKLKQRYNQWLNKSN